MSSRLQRVMEEQRKHPLPEWTCTHCGAKLPAVGLVWRARYGGWLCHRSTPTGFLCDTCATRNEQGGTF